MQAIRAVTLDAYGTVFDFEDLLLESTATVLRSADGDTDGVTAEELATAWGRRFHERYEDFGANWRGSDRPFMNIRMLTEEALADVGRRLGLGIDAREGTDIWLRSLHRVRPFPEVRRMLQELTAGVRVGIVSDTDDGVIGPALEALGWDFEFVLTSEGEQSYKFDPEGRLFRRALELLGLPAEAVLHVGDSPADVSGARQAGLRTAWVNRYGRRLPDSCPAPDFTVADLSSLPDLAGVRA